MRLFQTAASSATLASAVSLGPVLGTVDGTNGDRRGRTSGGTPMLERLRGRVGAGGGPSSSTSGTTIGELPGSKTQKTHDLSGEDADRGTTSSTHDNDVTRKDHKEKITTGKMTISDDDEDPPRPETSEEAYFLEKSQSQTTTTQEKVKAQKLKRKNRSCVYTTGYYGEKSSDSPMRTDVYSTKNEILHTEERINPTTRVLVVVPDVDDSGKKNAKELCEHWANKWEDEEDEVVNYEVVVPWFRSEREGKTSSDVPYQVLYWDGTDNEQALLGKPSYDFDGYEVDTSYKIFDKILNPLAASVQKQIVVAGFGNRAASFVQGWALVSKMKEVPADKDFRVQVVFGGADRYLFLDNLRSTENWKMNRCLGGGRGAGCKSPDVESGATRGEPGWSLETDDQLPAGLKMWYDAEPQQPLLGQPEVTFPIYELPDPGVTAGYVSYTSTTDRGTNEDTDDSTTPPAFYYPVAFFEGYDDPEALMEFYEYSVMAGNQQYAVESTEETPKTQLDDVSAHMRTTVFPKFQFHIAINEGDRCTCLGKNENPDMKKLYKKSVFSPFAEQFHASNYCGKKNNSEGDKDLPAENFCTNKKIEGATVDVDRLAVAQGFTRFQRSWNFYYWMQLHSGVRYLEEGTFAQIRSYEQSSKNNQVSNDDIYQNNDFSRALIQAHYCRECQHVGSRAGKNELTIVKQLLVQNKFQSNLPEKVEAGSSTSPARSRNKFAGHYARKLENVRVGNKAGVEEQKDRVNMLIQNADMVQKQTEFFDTKVKTLGGGAETST
ncbi:unnamed protein product [Amoebophrya sp. A120]|nr:unnamed protein product [Amoebophrya sp. A120]|eukprot:GSA120T00023940001.1